MFVPIIRRQLMYECRIGAMLDYRCYRLLGRMWIPYELRPGCV
jgi:hypothetical protein